MYASKINAVDNDSIRHVTLQTNLDVPTFENPKESVANMAIDTDEPTEWLIETHKTAPHPSSTSIHGAFRETSDNGRTFDFIGHIHGETATVHLHQPTT